jgi:hypothetical protein
MWGQAPPAVRRPRGIGPRLASSRLDECSCRNTSAICDKVFLQEHFDDNNVRTTQYVAWIVEVASCRNIGSLPAGRQDG